MKSLYLALGLAFVAGSATAQSKPELVVMTYDSFVSDWGPGPAVEAAFEASCDCDLKFVAAGDGAALLARLQLEGQRTEADIILGIDTNLTARAAQTGLFAPHGQSVDFDLPIAWDDPVFLPFDWGYFAFVHDTSTLEVAPKTLRELADSDVSIIIQDPRSSTPGLGLLLWVKSAYGDEAKELWMDLADNIVTVTPGWSEAYGLFLEGEADMVLSYTTSPAYHLIAEGDATKVAAPFDEGHYMQVEVAAKLATSDQPDFADQFLRFMASDAFQSIIPTTNWMYPARTPQGGLPDGFDTLIAPSKALLFPSEAAEDARERALEEWLAALSG